MSFVTTDGTDKPLPDVTCPQCGHQGVNLVYKLRAKKLGTWSLAGTQPKLVLERWPYIICPECGLEGEGEVIEALDDPGVQQRES